MFSSFLVIKCDKYLQEENESNSNVAEENFLEEPMTPRHKKIFLDNLGFNSDNVSEIDNNFAVKKSIFDEEKSNNNYGNNYNSAKEPTSPDERILDNSHS